MKPEYLDDCDPQQRLFPKSWKTAYWRLNGGLSTEGYQCPMCGQYFNSSTGFTLLEMDHIKPFVLGGQTIWENLQLLCKYCNQKKFIY